MKPGIMIYPILLHFFHIGRPRDLPRDPEAAFWVYGKILQLNLKSNITNHVMYHPEFAIQIIYMKNIKF